MKKIILILSLTSVIGALVIAQKHQDKIFTLKFNAQQLEAIWYVIDKSNAEHNVVQQVQQLINQQLKSQIDSTGKK